MSKFVRFQSTIWTMIRDAKADSPGAFDALVHLYREPVRRYLRSRNIRRELAEDLVQDVFLRVFQKDLLQKVEESKGKFRSFLLGVTNNIIRESRRNHSGTAKMLKITNNHLLKFDNYLLVIKNYFSQKT